MTLTEGSVKIVVPEFTKVSARAPVFYNPVMEFNRDVSVLAVQEFQRSAGREITVADTFSGSGVRAIRYLAEVDGVAEAWANDINPLAVEFMEKNSRINSVYPNITMEDAGIFLRKNRGVFDFIDIDPFGTPAPFLDSAAASIKNDSMIAVTATDTSSLCGTYKRPCIRKYGSKPLKTEYCHENGIRILSAFAALALARYKKGSEIILSHSTQHYMRIYIKVNKGAGRADGSIKNLGFIIHCFKCLFHDTVYGIAPQIYSECPRCGATVETAGPLWLGDIQNKKFVSGMIRELEDKALNKKEEVLKLLKTCFSEAGMPPGFYDLHEICSKLGVSAPPLKSVIDILGEAGFAVSRTHFKPTAIKTDAPLREIEDAVKNLL